ncbi:hypothetical protein PF008_g14359 [Phytophthora fragariae]|uniref:Ankyrin repeat-containing domain n=1 Tax=Phytophthora fragariae TaxID=53985 RepID=A0A6G0RIN9_9STRA|nr:hypothetical protein PF008_g14359 [Phytophthora fragariae]
MQYVAAREDPDEMDPFYRRWLFNKTTEMAAARGDLQSLQWLVESYLPDEFLTKAVAAAAANGHMSVLEWLFETHHDRGYWGNTEMCGALTNGHVKVVEWLRTHAAPRAECMTEVMDAAAGAGFLDIVTWLYDEHKKNRREGCTAIAMTRALMRAHFDVVLFLHANRLEDFSFLGTTFVRHSCIELAQWLLCHYADKLDGCEFEVPTSNWRFNEWCAKVNLHRAREYDASTWWVCESAVLQLEEQP